MSCNFSTGRFLMLCCISEMSTLPRLTTLASATVIGAEKKISVKPNTARIADMITIENSFDKQPIVPGRHSHIAFTAGQNILDPVPLIVPKGVAAHLSAPNQLTSHESRRYPLGNRLIEDRP